MVEIIESSTNASVATLREKCLEIESKGVCGMGLLFSKVDKVVLGKIASYNCFLIDCCLNRCLNEGAIKTNESKIVILISTTIKRIMTIMHIHFIYRDFSHPLPALYYSRLVNYIFRSWDSSIDVVCHESVDTFSLLLSNHSLICEQCRARIGCEWVNCLADQLFVSKSACRSHYKCIFILFRTYSSYLNRLDDSYIANLYLSMGNSSLSVVLSDILAFDMMSFGSRWFLHITKIKDCLSSDLENVRTAIMVDCYDNEHRLYSLLAISKFTIFSQKKFESYKKWTDYISVEMIARAILHISTKNISYYLNLNLKYNRYIFDLSFESLSFGANFGRRIMALSTIKCLFKEESLQSNGKTLFLDRLCMSNWLTSNCFKSLIICLDDPFQICQDAALELLTTLNFQSTFVSYYLLIFLVISVIKYVVQDFVSFRNETMVLMKSIRSHNTISSGYRMQVYFYAGPFENTNVKLFTETSQLLLACTWRAHKYVSAILAWLSPLSMLSSDHMREIGQYYWLQLTECKHCGAFETAVAGFTSVCSILWKSYADSFPSPLAWLNQILQVIEGKNDASNLCSTRRSAGLPHLITSILVTEPPNSSKDSVCIAMLSLLEMNGKSLNSRVHSLNVLTALFSSSLLCERITIALEVGFWACRVAVSKCAADSWLERNAAAQLAAALRARIFGVTRISQRDFHVDFKNRQSAYEFFSILFFSFMLLAIRGLPMNVCVLRIVVHNPFFYSLAPFIPACLRILLWCKAEKLRRLSAAALIAIAREEDVKFVLSWIESVKFDGLQQNHVHAIILLLTEVVDIDSKSKFYTRIENFVRRLVASMCDLNRNLFFILCNNLFVKYDVNMDVGGITLAKRPIAQLLLRSQAILTKEYFLDQDMRRELYRYLQKQETIEEVHKPLILRSIDDLKTCSTERDTCNVSLLF
uniref:DUF2428 domain-containing protein n=1 Tax=Heterorhabditis bacteriophora TaxID=37862 RepID=A0A1I7X1W3_HETBA